MGLHKPVYCCLCGLIGCRTTTMLDRMHSQRVHGVAIVPSKVLVLGLLDYVNPVQLWLCGLVRHRATTVHELRP